MALIVGIDLGRKSAHDAVILRRETAKKLGRSFRFTSTPQGLQRLFNKLEAVRTETEPVQFVIDSPGRAWVPIAAALKARGLCVYRPCAYRVHKLRQAGHRKNKTNRIDALTLARCLLNFPEDTSEVALPHGTQAALDQLVRHRDRLVDSARRRKQRIQDLCEAINPGLATIGPFLFTQPGRAFLRTYLDPRAAVRLGKKRLGQFLQKRYRLPLPPDTLDALFEACHDAVRFYKPVREAGLMPFNEELFQREMNSELDQLEAEEQRIRTLEAQIPTLNKRLDPHDAVLSLPGIGHVLAAGIRTCIVDIDRFTNLTDHKGFVGFYPSVKATGDHRAPTGHIPKTGCNRYKRCLYLAAENAYKWDLQMAAFYHKHRHRGLTHTQAVCAVANSKLLPRIHHLFKRLKHAERNHLPRPHYVFRDLSGNPISKTEARAIIQARWGNVSYS
jgi:transposase